MRRTSVVAAGVLAAGAVLSAPLTAGASTGAPIVLGRLPSGAYGKAADVNGAGVVVGEVVDATEDGAVIGDSTSARETDRPVRWVGGAAQDLGSPAGATSASAVAAAEGGAVVGFAVLSGFQVRAVLWPAA